MKQPTHVLVLRAVLRCARHRRVASRAALLVRVDCSPTDLDAALVKLADDGLIHSRTDVRLTLSGLTVAVATIAAVRAERQPERARTAA